MGNITIIKIFLTFLFISSTNQKTSNTNRKVSNTKIINPLIIQLSLILLVYLQLVRNTITLTQKKMRFLLYLKIIKPLTQKN